MKMLLNLLVVGSQLTWSQTTKKDLSITTLFACLISRTFSAQQTVFFSHNKSANSTFNHGFSAKRTGPMHDYKQGVAPQ
jgi:hypothetical protein